MLLIVPLIVCIKLFLTAIIHMVAQWTVNPIKQELRLHSDAGEIEEEVLYSLRTVLSLHGSKFEQERNVVRKDNKSMDHTLLNVLIMQHEEVSN
jgi:hypothetical protein